MLCGNLSLHGSATEYDQDAGEKIGDLHSYYWKMENNILTPETTMGYSENPLTRDSGSVTNGVLKNVRYSMGQAVHLYYDKPWIIEWKCKGNWSGMLLSSSVQSPSAGLVYLFRDPGSKIFAFGEYDGRWNNYGMVLDFDTTSSHVFRLENRIAQDGTNGIYLVMDGQEVGAMDRYYLSASYQNKTVNWAEGKDIVFTNIGTTSHAMNAMELEYLKIWEMGHDHNYITVVTPPTDTQKGYTTYICESCGYSYVDDYIDSTCEHVWTQWKEQTSPTCNAEGKDSRNCTVCGAEQLRDTRITGDSQRILVSDPLPEGYFKGKTILQIGDSITYGVGTAKTYGAYLAEKLGVTVINKGVSGSGYCSGGRMTTNTTLTEANVRSADLITIMLGVNDWAWAVKEGSWNGNPNYYDKSDTYYRLGEFDSTDTSTLYGALHSWCKEILRIKAIPGFENKEFVVITPLITSWNNSVGQRNWDQDKVNIHGHTFREHCTAIMEVCAYYDIPVFDANMFSGIYYRSATDNNVALTGGDGVHVNENGHALLAVALEEFLQEGYSYENREVAQGGHSYEEHVCRDCRLPYVCDHVYDSVVTKPTCTDGGYTVFTCVSCGDTYEESGEPATGHADTDIDRNNLCDSCGAYLAPAVLLSRSVSLNGNIGVNFYMSLSEEVLYQDNAYMLFTQEGKGPVKVALVDCPMGKVRGADAYIFTYEVSSKEMTDKITARFFYGDDSTEEYIYSVKMYSDNLRGNIPEDSALKRLLDAMMRYGAASQIHFNYHTERLADEGMHPVDYTDLQIRGFPTIYPQGTKRAVLAGTSLLLKSETTLRYFFQLDPSVEELTVTYQGRELEVRTRNGLHYVDVENISAPDLDESFTVTVWDGIESADVCFSPMAYCASVKENAQGIHNETTQNLVAALYLYNQAANAYFVYAE